MFNILGSSLKGFIAPELGLLTNLQELYVCIISEFGFGEFKLMGLTIFFFSEFFMGII